MARPPGNMPQNAPPVDDPKLTEVSQWVERELNRITARFEDSSYTQYQVLHVEPSRPRDGMVVVADGTDWNPGSGAGVYGRVTGTWIKLSGVTVTGAGAPGGASGNVQYNNAGSFGGLTDVQLTTRIQAFTSSLQGAVPPSGGGTTNFLRADGSWVAPSGGGGGTGLAAGTFTLNAGATSTVVADPVVTPASVILWEPTTAHAASQMATLECGSVGAGTFTLTHANNPNIDQTFKYVVSNAPGGGGGGSTVPGGISPQIQYNNGGSFGGLTDVQVTARIQPFTDLLSGAVLASGGGSTKFLRADHTWAVPPTGSGGGGDVFGPGAGTVVNDFALWNNTLGTSVKDGSPTFVTALLNLFTSALKGLVPPPITPTGTKFLCDNGSWAVPSASSGALFLPSVQTSVQGNPASSVETTLLSYTLPANSITVVGQGVKISAAGYWGSTSHIASIRIYFGSEVMLITNTATDGSRWNAEMIVIMTQTGPSKEFVTGRADANFLVSPFGSNPSVNMTAPVLIKVTGQGPGAAIANEAVVYQLLVEPLM